MWHVTINSSINWKSLIRISSRNDTFFSFLIRIAMTNSLVHFLLTTQTHNHLSSVYWHDILLHDNALLRLTHCRLSLTVVISPRCRQISTKERQHIQYLYRSVSTWLDMDFTNLYLVKIKEHLMSTYQQYSQKRRRKNERDRERDVYSDELLLRFLSSSHHIFLIATDGEWINHARNRNVYILVEWAKMMCIHTQDQTGWKYEQIIIIRGEDDDDDDDEQDRNDILSIDFLVSLTLSIWYDGQIDESSKSRVSLWLAIVSLFFSSFAINLHLSSFNNLSLDQCRAHKSISTPYKFISYLSRLYIVLYSFVFVFLLS